MPADDRAAARALVEAVTAATGERPLSDQSWLDLTTGDEGPAAALHRDRDGVVVALAQLAPGHGTWSVELVADERSDDEARVALVDAGYGLVDQIDAGHGPTFWWARDATPHDEALAARLDLDVGRRLLQMTRRLPTGLPVEVETRDFVPGVDEQAWVETNNRAFAGHPEQGGWTVAKLGDRTAEAWFDPAGFRLHERDGRLAAFCWTKLHPDHEPVLGEIYVIGVDPDFQGLGLGRQLTLAGLDSISSRGVGTGMLFVDAASAGAVAMYERLGFTVARTDLAFVR